ncbi:hypothetical protein RJ640_016707 [Escallonia rubra]|uniref:Uncharacterized protein n=1 Tax=Escallonia rubra TaxID=112253 RepID=A0AA88U9Y8_9ASTE|nr:hypothetical protein RJ640_016707 [Escallonia rubra]
MASAPMKRKFIVKGSTWAANSKVKRGRVKKQTRRYSNENSNGGRLKNCLGVSSLEQFPHLQNLQKLILSDNRIADRLEYLVEAGLESLRDLDLSNNQIQDINDLRPLAELKLVSLDLYECPVTRFPKI